MRMVRSAFKRTRCIVPASGYYEWRADEGGKRPYFINAANGGGAGVRLKKPQRAATKPKKGD